MKKTNINYPHPVLSASNEDYIDCAFDITLLADPVIEGNVATIQIGYSLLCPSLEALIAEEKARVVVYLESVVAEYRKIHPFKPNKTEQNITLNKNDINQEIEIRGYIIAADTLTPFKLPEHNKELLGDVPFAIRFGDILGVSEHFLSVPILDYDPLADRPSIFSVRQQLECPDEDIAVDFLTSDKIQILLNSDTYSKYQNIYAASELQTILASFLATSVLVDVLSYIKNATDEQLQDISEKKWFAVIQARIAVLKIDLRAEDSMTKVANQILPHIFKHSIESIKQVFDEIIPRGGENNET